MLALAGLALITMASFVASRAFAGDSVLGDVRVMGTDVGGLSPEELGPALEAAAQLLENREVVFTIRGSNTVLQPSQVALEFDLDTMAAEALAVGRQGTLPEQFRWWIGHFGDTEVVPTVADIDETALEQVLRVWDADFVGNPPFPGAVEFEGTTPVARYPRDGEQIDRDVAPSIILDAVTAEATAPVELPVVLEEATLTDSDVDEAVARARLWLSASITLRTDEISVAFTPDQMATALVTESTGEELDLAFDPGAVELLLQSQRGDIELPPENARFEIEGTDIRIVPGRNGTVIDPEATADAMETAAGSASRTAILPFIEGAEPEITTADLEAYNVNHLVSQFTTYHDCCQNRVTNIHLIADAVDGAIIAPGETFSLNDYVGPRTVEKGYLEDGTIVGGELTKTVGGGVSQFATTIYNAVFWGGYEDITHKAHSFYFSRYPEGIEATISWPSPDLAFRNDSDAAILIDTSYTDTSITVRLFGDNDGRSVALAYPIGGPVQREVLAEGGPEARVVTAEVSDRFNERSPTSPVYRPNPELEVDEQVRLQSPGVGWTVTVTRIITVGGGEPEVQEWNVVYSPREEILEVHPCQVPDTSTECPEPTTTTAEPPPTTAVTEPPPSTVPDGGDNGG